MPKLGQSCYIVIDSLNFVTLFGIEKDTAITFWSPIYTGSECLIKHSNLFNCNKESSAIHTNSNLTYCYTSIYISISNFLNNFNHSKIECGRIMFQNGEILFIPDFADSSVYTITDKKLNCKDGQKVCVEFKIIKEKIYELYQLN